MVLIGDGGPLHSNAYADGQLNYDDLIQEKGLCRLSQQREQLGNILPQIIFGDFDFVNHKTILGTFTVQNCLFVLLWIVSRVRPEELPVHYVQAFLKYAQRNLREINLSSTTLNNGSTVASDLASILAAYRGEMIFDELRRMVDEVCSATMPSSSNIAARRDPLPINKMGGVKRKLTNSRRVPDVSNSSPSDESPERPVFRYSVLLVTVRLLLGAGLVRSHVDFGRRVTIQMGQLLTNRFSSINRLYKAIRDDQHERKELSDPRMLTRILLRYLPRFQDRFAFHQMCGCFGPPNKEVIFERGGRPTVPIQELLCQIEQGERCSTCQGVSRISLADGSAYFLVSMPVFDPISKEFIGSVGQGISDLGKASNFGGKTWILKALVVHELNANSPHFSFFVQSPESLSHFIYHKDLHEYNYCPTSLQEEISKRTALLLFEAENEQDRPGSSNR